MKGFMRIAWYLFFAMAFLFIDFLTKAYTFHFFPYADQFSSFPYGGIAVFKNFLGIECSISLAINKGAAWGFFANFQLILVVLRILVILAMIFYLIFFNKKFAFEIPLILIITGAIGNIIDFFLYGFVVDFIHFKFWGYDFPVFNIADVLISLGVIWLFLAAYITNRKEKAIKIKWR